MRARDLLCVALITLASARTAIAADAPEVRRVRLACAAEVKEGFKLREDFWTGKAKAGARQALKHQLFRGNEYWFWLAVAEEGPVPSLKIYDGKGLRSMWRPKRKWGGSRFRLLPPRTGSYTVVFVFTPPEGSGDSGADVSWAMTYGYR